MKKAKIVLSAVALFAVVGGALAFKANRVERTFYITAPNGQCRLTTSYLYDITSPNAPDAFTVALSTTTTTAACPVTWVKDGN